MENGNGHESEPFEEDVSLDESEATQAVQVALNIRPLIPLERVQGCKECITVVPGEPQVESSPILQFHFGCLDFWSVNLSRIVSSSRLPRWTNSINLDKIP